MRQCAGTKSITMNDKRIKWPIMAIPCVHFALATETVHGTRRRRVALNGDDGARRKTCTRLMDEWINKCICRETGCVQFFVRFRFLFSLLLVNIRFTCAFKDEVGLCASVIYKSSGLQCNAYFMRQHHIIFNRGKPPERMFLHAEKPVIQTL